MKMMNPAKILASSSMLDSRLKVQDAGLLSNVYNVRFWLSTLWSGICYNKNMKNIGYSVFVTAMVLAGITMFGCPASAHQPIVVDDETNVVVTDPEISQAYYAELTGSAANYQFTAASDFALYVNILVPDISSSTQDYTVTIMRNGIVVTTLDPKSETWKKFNEPFGHDVYQQGPEYRATGMAGTYEIVVNSPDNQGQYVLAIGETENFPLSGLVRTVKEMAGVKKFYGKSAWAVFESPLIYGTAIGLVLVIGLLTFLVIRWRRRRLVGKIEKDIKFE